MKMSTCLPGNAVRLACLTVLAVAGALSTGCTVNAEPAPAPGQSTAASTKPAPSGSGQSTPAPAPTPTPAPAPSPRDTCSDGSWDCAVTCFSDQACVKRGRATPQCEAVSTGCDPANLFNCLGEICGFESSATIPGYVLCGQCN